jgi:hypothetical protein
MYIYCRKKLTALHKLCYKIYLSSDGFLSEFCNLLRKQLVIYSANKKRQKFGLRVFATI